MSDIQKIVVPDVGGDEVEVIELCVSVGDTLEADEGIVTVESDKASMDIPAPFEGEIVSLSVAVGDKIKEGDVIGEIKTSADSEENSSEADDSEANDSEASSSADAESDSESSSNESPKEESESTSDSAKSSGGNVIEVAVPDIGEDGEVDVIDVLVAVGDTIEKEDGLITLETDKATMDVPSSHAGTVKEVLISNGDKVKEGTVVIKLEVGGSDSSESTESTESSSTDSSDSAEKEAKSSSAASSDSSSSEVIEVSVPDIGEDGEVDVIDVLVSVGDTIEKEDGLITLETDKATMDVPSTHSGTVKEVLISTGDKVKQGTLVVKLETSGGASASSAKEESKSEAPKQSDSSSKEAAGKKTEEKSKAPAQKPGPASADSSSDAETNDGKAHASPSVRRVAREFGVDLTLVKGSGRKNRILKEDVQEYVKAELAKPKTAAASGNAPVGDNVLQIVPVKPVDHSKFGEVEEQKLSRIQKISGPFLHRNWATIPHVTQFDEADITGVEAFRKEQNAYHAKIKSGLKLSLIHI